MNRDYDTETPGSDAEPPLIEGKYAILAVLVLGLIGAIGAWAYRGQLQRKAIAYLGPDNAVLIQRAPHVVLMKLAPAESAADDGGEPLLVAGRRFIVAERVEADQAPGLIHLRSSLISDRSYDWSASPDSCKPAWQFALKFTDDSQRSATVLLDFACDQLLLLEADRQISMKPMADGLKKFLAAQFGLSVGAAADATDR